MLAKQIRTCTRCCCFVVPFRHSRLLPHRARCSAAEAAHMMTVTLQAIDLTPEVFEPFGQVVGPTDDGKVFDHEDAQLTLDKGTPRFYIMRIPERGLTFSHITYHANVTQCLGGLSPVAPWYIVVAAPSGSVQACPRQEQLTAFKVPHGMFVKFHAGTWHAGPLFAGQAHMDFYNLELSDTNVVDHNTHDYSAQGISYTVQEC
eukprot:GHRR01012023.1.p1 GENE.GHRR01012023.1~~GHRR01012023.1.p1  ORF type:complete len:203 (+),score=23.42 GHRR01012023.1:190-798(+)